MGNSIPEIIAEKAVFLTNTNRIKWQTIPDYVIKEDNAALEHFMLNENKAFYGSVERYGFRRSYRYNGNAYSFNDSFCAGFEGGLIYLFSVFEHPEVRQAYILAVQGSKDTEILKVSNETIAQDSLGKLYSLVKERAAEADDINNIYIDMLLNINEEE